MSWNRQTIRQRAWLKAYRIEAHNRQDGRCRYCTRPLTLAEVTAEHRVPRCKGGSTSAENIDAACVACNRLKGSFSQDEFLRAILKPSCRRDGWPLYMAGVEARLMRATEQGIAKAREQAGCP